MDGNSGIEGVFVWILGLFGVILWVMFGYAQSRRADNSAGIGGDVGDLGGGSDCGDGGDCGGD